MNLSEVNNQMMDVNEQIKKLYADALYYHYLRISEIKQIY